MQRGLKEKQNQPLKEEHIKKIQELASDIHYGTITLVFQDGILTHIDKSEKIRLERT